MNPLRPLTIHNRGTRQKRRKLKGRGRLNKRESSEKRILKSLLDISGFTSFVENPDLILSLIIEECILLTNARWGMLLSYDANLNLDTSQITKVRGEQEKARISSLLDDRIKDIVGKKGLEAALNENLWNKKDVQTSFKKTIGRETKNILICPIKKKGRFLGIAIVADKKREASFTKKDRENFYIICQEASTVIDNINLFKAILQSERMAAIGQAIAGISHYVKNILQGISTGTYTLNAGIKNADITMVKEAWDVVNKNTKRISELIMDMLYYSRERRLEKEKIDPNALVRDVLQLVRSRLDEKKVVLNARIKKLPLCVTVNEKGIHRSILNVILNAVEACDKPGSLVKFEAWLDEVKHALKITVSDNGRGMSKEELSRIFQPFYTNKKGKGTGLGLAITKKVIEEHNGSIKVWSELNKGTTFEISIPLPHAR